MWPGGRDSQTEFDKRAWQRSVLVLAVGLLVAVVGGGLLLKQLSRSVNGRFEPLTWQAQVDCQSEVRFRMIDNLLQAHLKKEMAAVDLVRLLGVPDRRDDQGFDALWCVKKSDRDTQWLAVKIQSERLRNWETITRQTP